jgi:hypothetical protein
MGSIVSLRVLGSASIIVALRVFKHADGLLLKSGRDASFVELKRADKSSPLSTIAKAGAKGSSETVAPFSGSEEKGSTGGDNFLIQLNQFPSEAQIGVVSVSGLGDGSFRIQAERSDDEATWVLDDGGGHHCASGYWRSHGRLGFHISSLKYEASHRNCELSGNKVLTRIIQIVQAFNQLGDKKEGIPSWVLHRGEAGSKPIPKITLTDVSVLQIDSGKEISTWRLYRLFEERKLPWYAGFGFAFSAANQALLRRLITASSILTHVPSESSSSSLPDWAFNQPPIGWSDDETELSDEEFTQHRAACDVWLNWATRVIGTECDGCEKPLFVSSEDEWYSSLGEEAEKEVRLAASNAPVATPRACSALAFLIDYWDELLRSTTLTLDHLEEFHTKAGATEFVDDVRRTTDFLDTVLIRPDPVSGSAP